MCKIYIILSLNKPNPKAESIERVAGKVGYECYDKPSLSFI